MAKPRARLGAACVSPPFCAERCTSLALPAGIAGENPAFEPAVRLAKRWVGAHLLSPHLGEEAVELLMAHCFTSSGGTAAGGGSGRGGRAATSAAPPPASRLSGLQRFLLLLAEHPWQVQPLIVDPNGELSAAQRDAIVRQHSAARAAGGAPAALCLPTPRDHSGVAWTAGRPSTQVLPRIAVLAQRSLTALEQLLLGSDGTGSSTAAAAAAAGDPAEAAELRAAATAAAVFSRDLAEYDVLISLRPDALPNGSNDLRLGKQAAAAAPAPARPQLGPALQAANQQLAALAEAAAGAKQSRAILKGIPQSELAAHGVHGPGGKRTCRGRTEGPCMHPCASSRQASRMHLPASSRPTLCTPC